MITFAMAACTDNENVDGETEGASDTVTDTTADDGKSTETNADEYGDDDVVVAPDSWFK